LSTPTEREEFERTFSRLWQDEIPSVLPVFYRFHFSALTPCVQRAYVNQ
jgi:hypothetical protein